MSARPPEGGGKPPPVGRKGARVREREAAALRANLRRRKEQARRREGRPDATSPESGPEDRRR